MRVTTRKKNKVGRHLNPSLCMFLNRIPISQIILYDSRKYWTRESALPKKGIKAVFNYYSSSITNVRVLSTVPNEDIEPDFPKNPLNLTDDKPVGEPTCPDKRTEVWQTVGAGSLLDQGASFPLPHSLITLIPTSTLKFSQR